MNAPPTSECSQPAVGVAAGLAAFTLWGLFPLYFKLVADIPVLEVVAHRVVWSVALLALVLAAMRRWAQVGALLRDRRLLGLLSASAFCLTANWSVFVWAVANAHVLETSLGYFINPLVSVLLGVIVLGERLSPLQWLAVAIAGVGIAVQVAGLGVLPWVALALAITFGCYGLIRKTAPVDAAAGLFVEVIVMLPAAAAYAIYLAAAGEGRFGPADPGTAGLLMLAGVVTVSPLLLWIVGAKRLKLSTIGFLQYLSPSLIFVLGVFAFGEPFDAFHQASFGLIWVALALFSFDAARRARAPR